MANVIEKVLFIEENEGWSYKTAKEEEGGNSLTEFNFKVSKDQLYFLFRIFPKTWI